MVNEEITRQVLKKKKKRWVQIFASTPFNDVKIGESYVSEPNQLVGRYLESNLMDLTNDVKKQNIKIIFKIAGANENKATADFVGYELVANLIKRVVRRFKSKIDDSFVVETNDNIKVRTKIIILTKSKTVHSILTKLRARTREYLVSTTKKLNYEEFSNELLNHNIQKNLRDILKKIYPVSVVEIRHFRRI